MLSLVRALATFARAFARCFLVAMASSCSNSASTSTWAYQTSRLRIAAACFIRARYSAAIASTTARRSAGGEPAVAAGDLKARGQPLHIPLPRAGQGLVEVVDVEHQLPLGGGEHPEVRQVRVTADLDRQTGAGVAARSAAMISAAPR